jgi:hypothetical protein
VGDSGSDCVSIFTYFKKRSVTVCSIFRFIVVYNGKAKIPNCMSLAIVKERLKDLSISIFF